MIDLMIFFHLFEPQLPRRIAEETKIYQRSIIGRILYSQKDIVRRERMTRNGNKRAERKIGSVYVCVFVKDSWERKNSKIITTIRI